MASGHGAFAVIQNSGLRRVPARAGSAVGAVPGNALSPRVDAGRGTKSLRAVMAVHPRPGGSMRRYVWSLVVLTSIATSLDAQGLRDKLSELFIFTAGKDPLFLGGTAGADSATALHADHFIPAARSENGTLISFISNAISGNVANLPVSATSGGSTFRFEGGVPVRTSVSAGPVFAERAQTLGRGRVFVGANVNRMHFAALRGVSLNGIEMTFTHQNVTGPACDSIVGSSCTPYGVPTHENDVIALRLSLDLDMTVTSFFVSFGLLDKVDIGVVLPIVSASLRGTAPSRPTPTSVISSRAARSKTTPSSPPWASII